MDDRTSPTRTNTYTVMVTCDTSLIVVQSKAMQVIVEHKCTVTHTMHIPDDII